MKRLLTSITAAILLAGCEYINQVIPLKPEETPEAAEPAKEEIQTVGEYTIHNISGSPVTALYLYPTGSSDKGKNYAESVLAEDNRIVLKYDAGEKAKETELTRQLPGTEVLSPSAITRRDGILSNQSLRDSLG